MRSRRSPVTAPRASAGWRTSPEGRKRSAKTRLALVVGLAAAAPLAACQPPPAEQPAELPAAVACFEPFERPSCHDDAPWPPGALAQPGWSSEAYVVGETLSGPAVALPATEAQLRQWAGYDERLPQLDDPLAELLKRGDEALGAALPPEERWRTARQAYLDFIARAPSTAPLVAYVRYRVAQVLWNLGEPAAALDQLAALLRARGAGTPAGDAELTKLAERDLVALYAESGRPPNGAFAFFETLAPEPLRLLSRLAAAYFDRYGWRPALEVYAELARRDPAGRCGYQADRTRVALAARPQDAKQLRAALDEQLATYLESRNLKPAEPLCAQRTAALLAEQATAWFVETVGDHGVRGSRDGRTMDSAVALYGELLEHFDAAELAGVRALPSEPRFWAAFNRGMILSAQGKLDESAAAFDAAAEQSSTPELVARARLAGFEAQAALWRWARSLSTRTMAAGDGPTPASERDRLLDERLVALGEWRLCHVRREDDDLAADEATLTLAHHALERRRFGAAATYASAVGEVHADLREDAEEAHLSALAARRDASAPPVAASCQAELLRRKLVLASKCTDTACDSVGIGNERDEASLPEAHLPPAFRRRHQVRVRMGAVQVSGRTPAVTVLRVVGQHYGQLRTCYEGALRRDPTPAAIAQKHAITVHFVIGRDGTVGAASTDAPGTLDVAARQCLARKFFGMPFPMPEGDIIQVGYGLAFDAERGVTRGEVAIRYGD